MTGAGDRLGPYELLSALGAGGMGEVWRARDSRLEREVAVKILPPGVADDEQFRQRFEREARTISSLNHPHVCTLHDLGVEEVGGRPVHYLVMELIEGESLADRLEKGPLPLPEVLDVGRQVASALDAAHRRGVVHRDLKPANVMLTKSGAKLLDFGLAKTAEEGPPPIDGLTSLPTRAQPLTREGTILGTFQYMAPEQLEGLPADARTDLFALGALLYEMATGRRAFAAESKTSLIAAIVSSTPDPVSAVAPMSPPALDHVIQRCLEKDPDDRWQSARDVANQLEWIRDSGSQAGVAAPIARRRRSREHLAWALVAVCGIALLALGWKALEWKGAAEQTRPVRAHILPPEGTTFEFADRDSRSLVLSPDGRLLVFSAVAERGSRSLWVRPLDSTTARPLPRTDGAIFPFWSPDSRTIAFFAGGKLKRVDVAGGAPRTICDAPDGRGGSWSRDGVIVFSPSPIGGLSRVSAAGGTPTALTEIDAGAMESTHRMPHFLPDGRRFLYTVSGGPTMQQADQAGSGIFLSSLDSPGERELIVPVRSQGILASSHLLYAEDGFVVARPFDLASGTVEGESFPIAEDVFTIYDLSSAVFTVAREGPLAYFAKDVSSLVLTLTDRSGEVLKTVGEPGEFGFLRLSPDGDRLAVTKTASGQEAPDLWVVDLTTGAQSRLTFDDVEEAGPVWSPDGLRIAYSRIEAGDTDMYVRPAAGGGEAELLHGTGEADEEAWAWSPDGRHLLFNRRQGGDFDLWALPLEGGEPFSVASGPAMEGWGYFSPDGRWVTYLSNESGQWHAYATRFPEAEGKWQLTSDEEGAYWIIGWTEDDQLLHVTSGQIIASLPLTVRGESIEVGPRERLMPFGGDRSWAANADGSRFVIAATEGEPTLEPVTLITDWLPPDR